MPDILVRDVSPAAKTKLGVQAAQNGRSLQAEARNILERAVTPRQKTFVDLLLGAAAGAEEDGFELPERQAARDFILE